MNNKLCSQENIGKFVAEIHLKRQVGVFWVNNKPLLHGDISNSVTKVYQIFT